MIDLTSDARYHNNSSNTLVDRRHDRLGLLGSDTLNIGGTGGETDLNGTILGNGNLIVLQQRQSRALGQQNGYGGTTEVVSGTLVLNNALALGIADDTPATGTTLDNGASLEIDGPLTIANELLTVPGPASTSTNVYIYSYNSSSSGVNVWTGDIYLGDSSSDWVDLESELRIRIAGGGWKHYRRAIRK